MAELNQIQIGDTTYDIEAKGYTSDGAIATALAGKQAKGDYAKKTADDLNAMINKLSAGTTTPVDGDYYVCQYVNGGTTNTTFYRRPVSSLWEYIKGKISSVLGLTKDSYGGKAAKATSADSATTATTATNYASGGGIATEFGNLQSSVSVVDEKAQNAHVAIQGVEKKVDDNFKLVYESLDGKAAASHNHSASNITSGTLPVSRGGTGATITSDAYNNLAQSGKTYKITGDKGNIFVLARAEITTNGMYERFFEFDIGTNDNTQGQCKILFNPRIGSNGAFSSDSYAYFIGRLNENTSFYFRTYPKDGGGYWLCLCMAKSNTTAERTFSIKLNSTRFSGWEVRENEKVADYGTIVGYLPDTQWRHVSWAQGMKPSAVGSSSKPVYVDDNGDVEECSYVFASEGVHDRGSLSARPDETICIGWRGTDITKGNISGIAAFSTNETFKMGSTTAGIKSASVDALKDYLLNKVGLKSETYTNADKVDGYHIVVGSVPSSPDTQTIYFF